MSEGDFSVRLIDLSSGKDLLPTPGHRAGVSLVALTPDGRQVVTAGWDHTLRFWDPTSGKELRRRTLPGVSSAVPRLLPGGNTYLWPGADKTQRVWDLETGEELRALRGDGTLSPDGKTLAALTDSGKTIRLLDPATGKTLHTLPGAADRWMGLYFTPDGRRLFVCREDRSVARWDVTTGEKLPSFPGPAGRSDFGGGVVPSFTAQFSPDGKFFVYGLQENYIPVLDAATGREVRRFPAAGDGACFFAFSPDGKTLAWAGWRSPIVYLGEMATGKERHQFTGHNGRVCSLAFSPDGKRLLTGAEDTTALVWDLTGRAAAGKKPPAALTPAELAARWDDLAVADAAAGYRAVRALAADPARSVAFLRTRLRPVAPPPDEKALAGWIADLDSEAFAVRERAQAYLEKAGEAALPALRKALGGRPGAETKRRLEELVARHEAEEASPAPERLRALRAVEALEAAGTPQAREVLQVLAEGAPGARLTEDARAALRRGSAAGR
jgi:WD40 repeat protein